MKFIRKPSLITERGGREGGQQQRDGDLVVEEARAKLKLLESNLVNESKKSIVLSERQLKCTETKLMDTSQKLMEESQTNASLLQLVEKLKKDAKRAEEKFEHDLLQTQSTFEEEQREKEEKIALLEKEASVARELQVELNRTKSKLAEVYYKEDKNVNKTKPKFAEVNARDDDSATIDEQGFFDEVAEHGWIDVLWQACDSRVFSSDRTFWHLLLR